MSENRSGSGLLRGTSIVAGLTLLSRILGFIRDVIVARLFGAGFVADAFVVAFRIPNLLRSVMAEGALSSAFVPIFTREMRESPQRGADVFALVSGFLILSTTLASALGIAFSAEIVAFFAPGFAANPTQLALCATLNGLMFPYIIFVSYVALLNGALNTVRIFGASAYAQVVMNLVLIAGGLLASFFDSITAVYILSWSVIAGGVVQAGAQLPALKRAGFRLTPRFDLSSPILRELVLLMIPAIIGAAVYQFLIFANTVMASLIEQGSVSWLFYADRVVQLPIGVFSIALASVLLPTLSSAVVSKSHEDFHRNLTNALSVTSCVILPCTALLLAYAHPIVSILFERGAFHEHAVSQTAIALQGYAIGLWAQSCHTVLARAFLAHRDTVTSTVVGVTSVIFSVLLSALLIGEPTQGHGSAAYTVVLWIRELAPALTDNLGHLGLALSASCASALSFLLLSLAFLRRFGMPGWGGFASSTVKSLIAAVFAVLPSAAVLSYPPVISLPLGLISFAVIFHIAAIFLSIPEYSFVRGLITRRLSRKK